MDVFTGFNVIRRTPLMVLIKKTFILGEDSNTDRDSRGGVELEKDIYYNYFIFLGFTRTEK